MLLLTFFCCRLVWGTYQSVRVFTDIYRALTETDALATFKQDANSEVIMFAGDNMVPLWLPVCYLASNLTLNGLNWYWFGKMIETLRKRFDPPLGTRKPEKVAEKVPAEEEPVLVEGTHIETPGVLTPKESNDYIGAVNVEKGAHTLKVQQSEVRSRSARRRG